MCKCANCILTSASESSSSAVSKKGEHDYLRIQAMTLQEAIEARHSVRAYKNEPLTDGVVKALEEQIAVLNREGKLHMQLILNEPKAFQGTMAKYGKFRNANNYIVMAGKKAEDLDERIGYYGEHLVLLAQTLGLNTCWVGLSYSKVPGTYELGEDEKFEHVGVKNNRHQIRAKKGFSMIGYTKMDLGIARYHFEIGAGEVNFDWV